MEFIVTNKEFDECKKLSDKIFLYGTFQESDKHYWTQEGFIINAKSDIPTDISKEIIGIYNYIDVDIVSSILDVKCDIRNVIPIYYYFHNNKFGLSNNPWRLASLFSSEIEVDEKSLISQLVYHVDAVPGRTLIKNLKQLTAGERLKYDFINNDLKIVSNYEFKYQPKKDIILEDELQYADDQFTKYFSYIKEHNSGKIAGFGCSGGLDSRLIAHYSNKVGMDTKYFVVGDFKNDRYIKSVTSLVSQKVAEVYGHDIKKISYSEDWLRESLLLDIRNHPFFFSQVFINPIKELPIYDYHIVGDPGGIAYLGDAVISGNLELLKHHTDFFIGLRKDANIGITDILRKSMHHLGISTNPYQESGICGLRHSKIDYVVGEENIVKARKELFDVIDNAPGNNSIEKWFYIHDNITTRYQYAAGYNSMNRLKPTYFLYYPFFYEQIKHFPAEYLRNKYFLKNLLLYVNPQFANIPDQNLNMMFQKQSAASKLVNRVELALRGRGLQILRMMKSKQYRKFVNNVFARNNPIFNQYIDSKKLYKSNLLFTYAGAQFLKLKMIIDIIYFKEYNSLIEIKEFEIVS